MSRAIQKGKKGEYEACELLKTYLDLDYTPQPNKRQTAFFKGDILLEPLGFGFEVKRREKLDLYAWWTQIVVACQKWERVKKTALEPIVMYRLNREPWQFLISAGNIGMDRGWLHVDDRTFRVYIRRRAGIN